MREDFRMFIMWHPRGKTYEQRIPLQRLEWSWEVTVENQSSSGADWKIVNKNFHSNPSSSTSEMPVLTPNIFDYPFPDP
jgi:hypothetical protein